VFKLIEELIEWIKLPQDLQHRFFELAEQEAKNLTETIHQLNLQLKNLKDTLRSYIKKLPSLDETFIVAAVDSSRSPKLSERLGVRYGVFAAGTIFLKGVERREEVFKAGVFKRKQALSQDKSRFLFGLLATCVERKMGLEALDKCDLLILDGSFYGFVDEAYLIKKSGLFNSYEKQVLNEAFKATEELRKSGKVISVIKRSHTRVIGGYLALKNKNNPFTTIIDKLILSMLMPEKSYFNYEDLIGEKPPQIYTRLATLASMGWPESDLMNEAEKRIFMPFEHLGLDEKGFKEMKRIQVKFQKDLPPCEIEYPSSIPLTKLLKFLGQKNFFNEATNLPIALDIIDDMVGLSTKFTEEFVSEVEGRVLEEVIKKHGSEDLVKMFFTLLNPQKFY